MHKSSLSWNIEKHYNGNNLIDWCFMARQHKIAQFVPIYQGGLLAQAFENSQRGTYKNIQLHAIQ